MSVGGGADSAPPPLATRVKEHRHIHACACIHESLQINLERLKLKIHVFIGIFSIFPLKIKHTNTHTPHKINRS